MKLLFRAIQLLLFSFFIIQSGIAQPGDSVTRSPSAMAFQKYVDYPVDYSTGIPQIGIPLYTISLPDYSFPISASFHASGRTTAMNFSVLGMNWALNSSGVISREVRGRPDESTYSGHVEKGVIDYSPQNQHYYEIMSIDPDKYINNSNVPVKDDQYDIYSISVNGISAKFIIKDDGTFVFLTYCPYTLTGGWNGFTLTDDRGIIYNFGDDGSGNGANEVPYGTSDTYLNKPTAWYLSSIITTSGRKIYFKYTHPSTAYLENTWIGNWTYKDVIQFQDCENWNQYAYDAGTGQANTQSEFASHCPRDHEFQQPYTTGRSNYDIIYTKEIDFDNGKVLFNVNNSGSNCLLTSCSINNNAGTLLKTIGFSYYPYLPGSSLSDKLPNNNSVTVQYITFQDSKNTGVEKYSFDYYPASSFYSVQSFVKGKDFWGYANLTSPAEVTTRRIPLASVHVDFVDYISYPYNYDDAHPYNINGDVDCKAPNLLAKEAGMIKTIHYPSGGSATYTYEANKIKSGQNIIEGPGIRIQQITSDDGYGRTKGKTYEYGTDGTGQTLVIPSKDNDYFTEKRMMIFCGDGAYDLINYRDPQHFSAGFMGSYKFREYTSDAVSEVEAASHFPTYYSQVTEYDYSAGGTKNGKTIYTYSNFSSLSNSSTIPSPNTPSPDIITIGSNDAFAPQIHAFTEWTTPQLLSKVIQKWDVASSSYKTITSTGINYITLNNVNIPQLSVYRYLEFPNPAGEDIEQQNALEQYYGWQIYTLLDRTISCAVNKPQSETTLTYDDAGNSLTTTTNYSYDNLVHVNPTRIATTTSDGTTKTKYITYPGDYSGSATNKSSMPMEQVTVETKGSASKVISGQINTYSNNVVNQTYKLIWDKPLDIASFKFSNRATGVIPPAGTAAAFSMDSKYASKVIYTYDTKNNPVTIAPDKNLPVSYILGYNQTYPIAEVKNAPAKDIFFTSFEEGDGNSIAGDSKTGQYSHTGTYSKSLSGLDAGAYILSYWTKSGSLWSLTTSNVTVPAGGIYSISLSTQIDELRFYPANAFMKSYTYQPLIGMTSQDDEKSLITFYEYDDYERLKIIRDKDGYIVKKICYNEQGMESACEVYGNQYQSTTYYKNNCSCSSKGGAVPVTVQPNTYFSTASLDDANQQAINYIAANGQATANSTGSCTAIASQTINYINNVNDNVDVTFTNKCTSVATTYTLSPHTSPTIPVTLISSLAGASYDVKMISSGHTLLHSYTIGSYSSGNVLTANFSNLIFTSTTTITVN